MFPVLVIVSLFAAAASVLAAYFYAESRQQSQRLDDAHKREQSTFEQYQEAQERLFQKLGVPAPFRDRVEIQKTDEPKRGRRVASPSSVITELKHDREGLDPQPAPKTAPFGIVPPAVKDNFVRDIAEHRVPA
jgi:hypothetical protein